MTDSYGTFPINLARGIMANFGRIELFQDKIIISDPSMNTLQDLSGSTVTINLSSITTIELKTWLFFNSRVLVCYQEEGQQKTINFTYGDTWSTNMFKTIYLYDVLSNLKRNGICDTTLLAKTAIEDKISVVLMFVGCFVGLFLLTSLLGFYGKEFSLIYMFIGSAVFGIPACYFYLIKTKGLIKSIERKNSNLSTLSSNS